jgi:Ala-tRNA(Pro) deacylase
MATAQWIRSTLQQRGVAFEELHHPEAFTAQRVAQAEHVSGHRVAKVVVVMADGRPVELVLPASRRVSLDRVRQELGAKEVRLASEEEMARFFTGCEVGAMPPLDDGGHVPVVVDRSMCVEGDIVIQAGTHEDAIRLRCNDWVRVVGPRVASFCEEPAATTA